MSEQITPNPSVPSQVVAEVTFPKFINNLGIIPTSYKDSMSYYECLAWLCKYLEETVIPSVNQNGDAVEELQNLYIELNSYVTNYFENLNVQEEINHKLDDLVEDGTLTELIGVYVENEINPILENMNNIIIDQGEEIVVLENRMDTFTNLTEGSTSGDAELEDIRIGYSGITSSNAGNSVRNQASDLRDIINNEIEGFYTRLKGTFVHGSISNSAINPAVDYRIMSYNKLKYTTPIYIPYEIGIYRNIVVTYESNEATSGTNLPNRRGWLEVPANTYFNICTRKQTETTSSEADIYEFQKACVFVSNSYFNNLNIQDNILNINAETSKKTNSDLYTTSEISGTLTTGKYINVINLTEQSSVNGQYLLVDSGFNPGDIVVINGYTASTYNAFPTAFFMDENNLILKTLYDQNGDTGVHENVETVIPYNTSKIYINGSLDPSTLITPSIFKKTYQSNATNIVYPLNIAESLVREAKKNPFRLATLDKGYISFVFDDLRRDIDLVASIFAEYNYPLGIGAIPQNLTRVCNGLNQTAQGYTVGMTTKEVCDRIVLLGGEIMAHNSNIITSENQYDYDFMYNYFISTKKQLENNGYTIRGLIRAGGAGAISETPEIEKWLIGNYEYSNQGTADNYNQDRVSIATNLTTLKAQILDAYNNHTWIKIMGHDLGSGSGQITEANLRELLSYCNTIGIDVVTYAHIFDSFSSSQFLNSLS